MSMQALNHLVARSIIDPTIVQRFSSGQVGEVLSDFDFSTDLLSELQDLPAETWAEFSVMAYRIVKLSEPVHTPIELPSPAEGLLSEEKTRGEEQVA